MYDSAKYLIHADIRASGVVERSDVVGAVFGQTEGLLGDELDLRDLQESQKLGRIDVEIESEGGTSFGDITIASGLDKVETAILAAALESIERVGPCRADVEITDLEDARSAKRREVIERAGDLLAEFDDDALTSRDLVEEVRQRVRVEDVTEYRGLPAGPRAADSDAIIVVEGRADVLTLLRYGVKNAVAVEGTNVPDAVAELTRERTVTAFLDGDRGGDLILRELAQVGEIDYVAIAPEDRSVEDLSRGEVMTALRKKVPYESLATGEGASPLAATDGSAQPAPAETAASPPGDAAESDADSESGGAPEQATAASEGPAAPDSAESAGPQAAERPEQPAGSVPASTDTTADSDPNDPDAPADPNGPDGDRAELEPVEKGSEPRDDDAPVDTLSAHVEAVRDAGRVRLLDGAFEVLADGPAGEAFDLLEGSETVPATVVLDDELSQRVLDVAAQRGVDRIVARSEGEYVKQPVEVRVTTFPDL